MTAKAKVSPASKFLIAVVVIIVLFLIGFLYVAMNPGQALKVVFVPSVDINDDPMPAAPDYADSASWFIRPDLPPRTSTYRPAGVEDPDAVPAADVFFLHPTTYLKRAHWNAPLDDATAEDALDGFSVAHQLTSFATAGQFYLPRYRQATLGAFLDESGQGDTALERAYPDVLAAFDHYIKHDNKGRPFILAAHSQGSLHGLQLLKDRIAGTPLAARMVAAYLIGWPVSEQEDIGALDGIHACSGPTDTGCVISWMSYAPDGDISDVQRAFDTQPGLSGRSRAGSQQLCTNPLNWTVGGTARETFNKGAVQIQKAKAPLGEPILGLTGASCGDDGFLYLTRPPMSDAWTEFLMAEGDYHVYDYNLFYMNIRHNAADRVHAWIGAKP